MAATRFLALAAALAACAPPAAEDAKRGDPAGPERPRDGEQEARYRCDDGRIVLARYRDGGQSGLRLIVDGRSIDFYPWPAGGGFATEDGLRPGHGLYWRSADAQARLYENALDDSFRPGDERLIASCRREG